MPATGTSHSARDREPLDSPPAVPTAEPAAAEEEGFWSNYWERFRRQQVDDPVEERREGMWDRFRRQDVDDPVGRRRT